MPRIFDNIDLSLLPALQDTLDVSYRADFCVGYFNLRGWRPISPLIDAWSGTDSSRCRLLVGVQSPPEDQLRTIFSLVRGEESVDQQEVLRLKKRMAEEFRQQLIADFQACLDGNIAHGDSTASCQSIMSSEQ